jgi:hypothetical protein
MHRHVSHRANGHHSWWRCRLPAAVLALRVVALSHAVAAPAAEYGPEAEAGFRARCEATGVATGQCQAIMEALQARIGYAAFLDASTIDPPPAERFAGIRPGATPGQPARRP